MSEEGVRVAALVEKLAAWVEQQPEYPYLFLADRGRRRRAARIVANRLLLIPTVAPDAAAVDRKSQRDAQRRVIKLVSKAKRDWSKRQNRLMAKAQRDRARYARLGDERRAVLEERARVVRERQAEMVAAMEAELEKAQQEAATEAAIMEGD